MLNVMIDAHSIGHVYLFHSFFACKVQIIIIILKTTKFFVVPELN